MKRILLSLTAIALAACSTDSDMPLAPRADVASSAGGIETRQIYTATNSPSGNAILTFDRAGDGTLTPAGTYATSGFGTGSGLGNQNGIVITPNGRLLLAVNAGSDDISSFLIQADGSLQLADVAPSGGSRPISVASNGSVVYVLNAGGSGNISGLSIDAKGDLSSIAGSTQPLSSAAAGPAQIAFSPNGQWLVVTEKATNALSTYRVSPGGLASGPVVTPSSGATPFGFAFTANETVVVSEAFGGAANSSAVSSYEIGAAGALQVLSASVPTTETSACWIAVLPNGRFAYAANAASATISGYRIQNGALSLLDADGVTADIGAGGAPVDLAASRDGRFLYSLHNGAHTIGAWAVGPDGSLTSAGSTAVPAGVNGLAVR
jgi:6-phosphogluconolactonase